MSADDDLPTGDAEARDHQQELARLNSLHDDLVEAVQTAINPTVRADLAAELRSVRERIAELSIAEEGGVRWAAEAGRSAPTYPPPRPPQAPGSTPQANGVAAGDPGDPIDLTGAGYGHEDFGPDAHDVDDDLADAPSYGYQQPEPPAGYPGSVYPGDREWGRRPVAGAERPLAAGSVRGGATGATGTPRQTSRWSGRSWPLLLALAAGVALVAVVGLGGLFGADDGDEAETVAAEDASEDPAGASSTAVVVDDIRNMLTGMGYGSVGVDELNGAVSLSGTVASDADRQAVIGAASALAGELPFDSSQLGIEDGAEPVPPTVGPGDPAAVMQRELDRILAGTPIRFDEGQVAVTDRHQAILNNVLATLAAYPGQSVTVVGYTDDGGSPAANEQLSTARAQNVKDHLVSQGVSGDRLTIRAIGEAEATGVAGLANLERRVEFEVDGVAVAGTAGLRVGVVAPSASDDLAFTQSMVDALDLLAQERGLDVSVTDSTFVEADAEAALRGYAEQGVDLVIAHGSQFGALVQGLAIEFPGITFAWGTASDTFGLPNVYAYDARAQEGGYVLGALAAAVSSAGNLGVVGPLEVGDAALYINGFQAGAEAERPGIPVGIDYIQSFSDIGLAAEAATGHLDNGADVLTGSAQMVVGAVDVAATRGALWFGTQADQASLAPNLVVASQVYRWEVLLRPILDDVAAGRAAGASNSLTLGNGGLVIAYNDGYPLAPEARQRADQLVAEIVSGAVAPPG